MKFKTILTAVTPGFCVKVFIMFLLLAQAGAYTNCLAAKITKEEKNIVKEAVSRIPAERLTETLFAAVHEDERVNATPFFVQELIKAGADVNKMADGGTEFEMNVLGLVILQDIMSPNSSNEELIKVLVKNGADVNAPIYGLSQAATNIEIIERITSDFKQQKNKDADSKILAKHYDKILGAMKSRKKASTPKTSDNSYKIDAEYAQAEEITERTKAAEALIILQSLAASAERYKLACDKYPDSFDMLDIEVPGKTQKDGSIIFGDFTLQMRTEHGSFYFDALRKNKDEFLYALIFDASGKKAYFKDLSGKHDAGIEDLTELISK